MAIKLPKERGYLTGVRFNELVPFEMNWITLDTVLPPVFRLAVLEGSDAARIKVGDLSNIDRSIKALSTHERIEGFDGERSERMLRRLAEALLFVPVTRVKTKETEVEGLVPYTMAPFAVGFPTDQSGFRQVDRALYSMLLDEAGGDQQLIKLIKSAFGEGIEFEGKPFPSVRRSNDQSDELDVISELSVAYAEGFPPVRILQKREGSANYIPARPLPVFQSGIGRDLFRFLESYSGREPRSLLINQLKALIAAELAILTIKLYEHVPNWMSEQRSFDPSNLDEDGPEIYLDFHGDPRHFSRKVASQCVRRDVDRATAFLQAMISMRYLNLIVTGLRKDPSIRRQIDEIFSKIETGDTPKYLAALFRVVNQPDLASDVRAQARQDLLAIISANRPDGVSDEDLDQQEVVSDAERFIEELADRGLSLIEQVQTILVEVQMGKGLSNLLGWFRDICRVEFGDGLVQGGAQRTTWAYAPSNDLLMVLVQLKAVDYKGWNPRKSQTEPHSFGVQEFLDWLYDRFSIVVDRPPSGLGMDGPEYATAARENLQAMLRKLRLMGMFEDQSDDFSVQQITPPFMEIDPSVTEVGG